MTGCTAGSGGGGHVVSWQRERVLTHTLQISGKLKIRNKVWGRTKRKFGRQLRERTGERCAIYLKPKTVVGNGRYLNSLCVMFVVFFYSTEKISTPGATYWSHCIKLKFWFSHSGRTGLLKGSFSSSSKELEFFISYFTIQINLRWLCLTRVNAGMC